MCQKWLERHQRWRRKKIFSNSLSISGGEGDPFVGLRCGQHGSTVFAEADIVEKFVGFPAADADGGLLRQLHLKSNAGLPVLQNPVVIPVHRFTEGGPKIDDLAFRRPPQIAAEGVVLADVDAIDESQFAAEIWREIVVVGGNIEVPAAVRGVSPQRIALLRPDG